MVLVVENLQKMWWLQQESAARSYPPLVRGLHYTWPYIYVKAYPP